MKFSEQLSSFFTQGLKTEHIKTLSSEEKELVRKFQAGDRTIIVEDLVHIAAKLHIQIMFNFNNYDYFVNPGFFDAKVCGIYLINKPEKIARETRIGDKVMGDICKENKQFTVEMIDKLFQYLNITLISKKMFIRPEYMYLLGTKNKVKLYGHKGGYKLIYNGKSIVLSPAEERLLIGRMYYDFGMDSEIIGEDTVQDFLSGHYKLSHSELAGFTRLFEKQHPLEDAGKYITWRDIPRYSSEEWDMELRTEYEKEEYPSFVEEAIYTAINKYAPYSISEMHAITYAAFNKYADRWQRSNAFDFETSHRLASNFLQQRGIPDVKTPQRRQENTRVKSSLVGYFWTFCVFLIFHGITTAILFSLPYEYSDDWFLPVNLILAVLSFLLCSGMTTAYYTKDKYYFDIDFKDNNE